LNLLKLDCDAIFFWKQTIFHYFPVRRIIVYIVLEGRPTVFENTCLSFILYCLPVILFLYPLSPFVYDKLMMEICLISFS